MPYDTWDPTALRQLRTFLVVADTRSFSIAAERTFVSQPAVSQQIKALEKRLGARLFDRGRRLGLTEAGYALMQRARLAQGLMEALEATLEDARRGHLELGASSVWEYILPPLMAEFQSQHPDVYMGLRVANSEQIAALVAERDIHLGFVGASTKGNSLEAIAIAEDKLVLIAPAGHPLACGDAISPSNLHRQVFVQREAESATAQLCKQYLKELEVEARVEMELGSDEAVKAAVRHGYGLAMISEYSVSHEVLSGTLGIVTLDAPPCTRQLYAIKDATRRLSRFQESFLLYVSDSCARGLILPQRQLGNSRLSTSQPFNRQE
ncbi:MAG: LysR family transcriptional regulator [Chloroflexota bacterium]